MGYLLRLPRITVRGMTKQTWATIAAAVLGCGLVLDLLSLLLLSGEEVGTRVLFAVSTGIMLLGVVLFFLRRVPVAVTGVALTLGVLSWWARLGAGLIGGNADGEDLVAVVALGAVGAGLGALLISGARVRSAREGIPEA